MDYGLIFIFRVGWNCNFFVCGKVRGKIDRNLIWIVRFIGFQFMCWCFQKFPVELNKNFLKQALYSPHNIQETSLI